MRIDSVGIFLTRRCNFRCPYCCTETGVDPPDKMSRDELESVVRQARQMGARWLVIPGEGEPLLDENLFPLVDFAESLGLRTKVYTNGALLDASLAARLFASRVSVVFKLHAFDSDTYNVLAGVRRGVPWDEYDGVRGAVVKIPRGLRLLLEAGYSRARRLLSGESLLQIEGVVIRENLAALPDIARWCKAQRIDFQVETLLPTRIGEQAAGLSVTSEEERALFREVRRILGWKFACAQRVRCRFETNPFVDLSGNLRHCFGLAAQIGNIREMPLAELHKKEMAARRATGLLSWPIALGRSGFRRCAYRRFVSGCGLP
jgi:MoaA/NifB/PqqE/SkfB family radical SAM enzyme